MMHLVCVPPADALRAFNVVEGLLRPAFAKTGLGSVADLRNALATGRSLLWLGWSGEAIEVAATTSIEHHDAGTVCVISACGGRHQGRWLHLIDAIEFYAAEEGCRALRIYGRKGWLRLLPDLKPIAIVADRPVNLDRVRLRRYRPYRGAERNVNA